MTKLSKADERWLACVDRAIPLASPAFRRLPDGTNYTTKDVDEIHAIAEQFFKLLPSNR